MNRRHFIHGLLASFPLLAGCTFRFWVDTSEELETLTMSKQGYSVKYPSGWTVNTDDPQHVKIRSHGDGDPYMSINKNDIPATVQTLEDIIPSFKRHVNNELGYKLVGERSTTLPNDQPAMVFDAQISDTDIRATYGLAVENGSLYLIAFFISKEKYKSRKDEINTIVTSLTIT